MVDLAKDFKPPLYNIWKLDKQDNATISRVLQSDQMVEMQQKFKPPLSPVTRGYRGKPDRESKIRATNIASASFWIKFAKITIQLVMVCCKRRQRWTNGKREAMLQVAILPFSFSSSGSSARRWASEERFKVIPISFKLGGLFNLSTLLIGWFPPLFFSISLRNSPSRISARISISLRRLWPHALLVREKVVAQYVQLPSFRWWHRLFHYLLSGGGTDCCTTWGFAANLVPSSVSVLGCSFASLSPLATAPALVFEAAAFGLTSKVFLSKGFF